MDWLAMGRHHAEKEFMQRQGPAHIQTNSNGNKDANKNVAMGRIYTNVMQPHEIIPLASELFTKRRMLSTSDAIACACHVT